MTISGLLGRLPSSESQSRVASTAAPTTALSVHLAQSAQISKTSATFARKAQRITRIIPGASLAARASIMRKSRVNARAVPNSPLHEDMRKISRSLWTLIKMVKPQSF